MVPKTLEHWTKETILDLLIKQFYECEYFDFKVSLPNKNDVGGKVRLREACCAFANSQGGFLVFGIDDETSKTPEARLVGIDPQVDFPEHFGSYTKECSPSIYWDFRNPPLPLSSGKVIHICSIPKSWNAPHGCRDNDGPWRFYKRTNKGNEPMGVDEIRGAFLGFYEKRMKLRLLVSELEHISNDAQLMFISEEQLETELCTNTFQLNVLEAVLSDTFTLLVHETELLQNLRSIRRSCKTVNDSVRQILNDRGYWDFHQRQHHTRKHNLRIRFFCGQIQETSKATIRLLEPMTAI